MTSVTPYEAVEAFYSPEAYKRRVESLVQIRDSLESSHPGFPNNSCSTAVKFLYDELRLLPEGGSVFIRGRPEKHSVSLDCGGAVIVDLTLGQFNLFLPDIVLLPRENYEREFGYIQQRDLTQVLRDEITRVKSPGFEFRALCRMVASLKPARAV